MRIGIIGGGGLGQTMGAGLIGQGHEVRLGLRDLGPEAMSRERRQGTSLADWAARTGGTVTTVPEAAGWGDVVVNATPGTESLAALAAAGAALDGKVLIDVGNPLDFSRGMPPFLHPDYAGPTSLAERIQAAHPRARVVKAFNTVNAAVMVDPSLVPGEHDLFIAGDDAAAKEVVAGIARGFGWRTIVDLGDVKGARASEAFLPIWVRLMGVTGTPIMNLHLVRAEG